MSLALHPTSTILKTYLPKQIPPAVLLARRPGGFIGEIYDGWRRSQNHNTLVPSGREHYKDGGFYPRIVHDLKIVVGIIPGYAHGASGCCIDSPNLSAAASGGIRPIQFYFHIPAIYPCIEVNIGLSCGNFVSVGGPSAPGGYGDATIVVSRTGHNGGSECNSNQKHARQKESC